MSDYEVLDIVLSFMLVVLTAIGVVIALIKKK